MKTLKLIQMELVNGGTCQELADGISGAAIVIGVASWWSGFGAGIAAVVGIAAFATAVYCEWE